jgi:hypothetical protein
MYARSCSGILWSPRNVRKAALSEWGLHGFLSLNAPANFLAVLRK